MANKTLTGKILHVAKTTSQWESETAIVTRGLLCVEFTVDGKTRLKIGDGLSAFASLPYCDNNVDLSNYYTKTETDSLVSEAISALGTIMNIKGVVTTVSNLPSTGNSAGDVYFVESDETSINDAYLEYVWVVPVSGTASWEYIGKVEQEIDLSGYATITYVDEQIATLTALSHTHANKTVLDNITASYTLEEQSKLDGIDEGAEVNQNAFSHIVVGTTTVTADSKTDTLTFVAGSNVTITADEDTDTITINATGGSGGSVTVDDALSTTSTNPVQNKIITAELNDKIDVEDSIIINCTL